MNKSKENGISLIILIITIIILLILTSITVNFMGDGELINKAKKTANTIEKQADEQEQLANDVRKLYD